MNRSFRRLAWILVFFLWTSQSYADKATDTTASPPESQPAPSQNVPSIDFPEVTHEFGEVMEGAEVVYEFKVRNTGSSVLQIAQVRPG